MHACCAVERQSAGAQGSNYGQLGSQLEASLGCDWARLLRSRAAGRPEAAGGGAWAALTRWATAKLSANAQGESHLQPAGVALFCDTGRPCCAVERQDDLKLLEMAPGGGDALAKGKVLVPKALDADDEEDAESDDESDDDEVRLSPWAGLLAWITL